jgi:predicted O-methyltransferase YrrM
MIEKFLDAIKNADSNGVLIKPEDNTILTGFSGEKLFGTLQRLARLFEQEADTCYLEVGVFQGLTLLSTAIASPEFPCYGIDNFAYLDPKQENFNIIKQRIEKLAVNNVSIIDLDYEDALESLSKFIGNKKIGVYFIDGPHDYRSQLMCLQLALPYLHEQAVIIVDDSNYQHVRQANRDFLITHPEYKLLFESYTQCHPQNMTADQQQEARTSWWDGVNILVRDIENKLQPMYPPTERSRQLYENDHIIHAAKLAEFSVESVILLQSLYDGNMLRFANQIVKLQKPMQEHKVKYPNRKEYMNTSSEDLPISNFNKL